MCQILLRSAADWLRSVGGDTVFGPSRGGTGSELQEPMLRRFLSLPLRSLGTAASLLIALALLIATVNAHHPLQHWLVYRYATYCALAAFFLVSWALGGASSWCVRSITSNFVRIWNSNSLFGRLPPFQRWLGDSWHLLTQRR